MTRVRTALADFFCSPSLFLLQRKKNLPKESRFPADSRILRSATTRVECLELHKKRRKGHGRYG